MKELPQLFENNRRWARRITASAPTFFEQLARQQSPQYLWIGCADSRVPANEIVGLLPGELFVHRNIANLVVHSDMNCLAVIQYAVEVLRVRHIIVCGHYGCGGVQAALERRAPALVDHWLGHVREIQRRHQAELQASSSGAALLDRLCELNVTQQVRNVGYTATVQDAWTRAQPLSIHGWIYRVSDGLLQDLGVCVSSAAELHELEPSSRLGLAAR
jgi:carbonic anhydrase